MPKPSIAYSEFIQEFYGGKLLDDHGDGVYSVEMPDEFGGKVVEKVKMADLMANDLKELGQNPDEVTFEASTPENPLMTTGLGFLDQGDFSLTRTPKDKMNWLTQKFGEGNVRFNKDLGSFVVKLEDGKWQVAETDSGIASLVAQAPVLAGAIGGSIKGAAMAGLPGAVIGAGLGAALGSMENIAAAHAYGIRSEFDAADAAKEVGWEAITAAGGELTGIMLLKGLAKTRAAVNGIKKMTGSAVQSAANKEFIASNLSRLTNVDKIDAMTALEHIGSMEDDLARVAKFEQIDPAKRAALGGNPVKREMIDSVEQSIQKVINANYDEYGKMLSELKGSKTLLDADISGVVGTIRQQLSDLGLYDLQAGRFLKEGEQELAKVVTPSGQRALRKALGVVERAASKGAGILPSKEVGALTFEEGFDLLRALDEINSLHPSSQFAPSPRAAIEITKMRGTLHNTIMGEIERKGGQELYSKVREIRDKYSGFRTWLDEASRKTGDKGRVQSFTERMLSKGGEHELASFHTAMSGAGIDADKVILDLYRKRAAVNIGENLHRTGMTASTLGAIADVPGQIITSPRRVVPFTARSFQKLRGLGKISETISAMPPKARLEFLKNPGVLQGMIQTVDKVTEDSEATRDQLLQQGLSGGQ